MHNPIDIFNENWKQAKLSNDANANYCSLASVASTGQVSIRTLVLREVTDDSFVIFIDNTSPKWEQLEHSSQVELLVFWPSLMQQYRVRGKHTELDSITMKHHWDRKPYISKLLDHYRTRYHSQSSVIDSKETLLSGIDSLKARFPNDRDIPFPENAKGISIQATYMETWHGSASDQLHERHLYTLSEGQWERGVLVP